mmetsp:Transcript_46788/g.115913  ORF Transcript_46788/g.115913 Transcript_46788/m.115913 type:complete len:95 (+) Transcript_46788:140-424(+)
MLGREGLRSFLRLLKPCRNAQHFRSEVVGYARRKPATAGSHKLSKEYLVYLRAQAHMNDLNLRYFPQSGMTERELLGKIANRVGFKAPEWKNPE